MIVLGFMSLLPGALLGGRFTAMALCPPSKAEQFKCGLLYIDNGRDTHANLASQSSIRSTCI